MSHDENNLQSSLKQTRKRPRKQVNFATEDQVHEIEPSLNREDSDDIARVSYTNNEIAMHIRSKRSAADSCYRKNFLKASEEAGTHAQEYIAKKIPNSLVPMSFLGTVIDSLSEEELNQSAEIVKPKVDRIISQRRNKYEHASDESEKTMVR